MNAEHLVTRDPLTGLTAADAMQMGSEKFVTRYQAKTRDASEAGTRSAQDIYSLLLYTRSHLLANALPAERQGQFQQADALLERLVDAHYAALAARDGFGTMQLDLHAAAVTVQQETLTQVLAGLQQPQANPTARHDAGTALLAVNARCAALAHSPQPPEHPAEFQHALQTLQQVVDELNTLLPTLPDPAAQHLAGYVREGMKLED